MPLDFGSQRWVRMIGFGHIFLFLHIGLIATGLVVAFGADVLLRAALATNEISTVRAVVEASRRAGPFVLPLFAGGSLFGILTAIAFGYSLTAPWLVIAYVVFMVQGLVANLPDGAWIARFRAALASAPSGPVPAELHAVLSERGFVLRSAVGYVGIVILLFDMVAKPFS